MQMITSENVFLYILLLHWFEMATVMLVFSKQVALKLLIHPYNQEIKLHKRVYDHTRRLDEEKGRVTGGSLNVIVSLQTVSKILLVLNDVIPYLLLCSTQNWGEG